MTPVPDKWAWSTVRKTVLFLFLTATLVLFTFDAFVTNRMTPRVVHSFLSGVLVGPPVKQNTQVSLLGESSMLVSQDLKQTNTSAASESIAAMATRSSWVEKLSPQARKFAEDELRKLGFESTEGHEFKSPFIITPVIYSNLTTPKAAISGNKSRSTKTISCFNCLKWFTTTDLNLLNRDFTRCPYSECKFYSKWRGSADMVIIFPESHGVLPKSVRRPGQIWTKAFWESPAHYGYPRNYQPWRNVFNWTFTYRTDSDIFAPSNRLIWRHRSLLLSDREYLDIAKQKTRTAAWWVSNCPTVSRRKAFVQEMKKYIDVDIYGHCGSLKCARKDYVQCERKLTTTYKFYLSFENSLCKDYVTEKFFRSFQYRSHIIPVVRGGLDYDRFFPKDILVNAAHFKNAKELALYLKELGSDTQRYAAMLKEKDRLVSWGRKYDWCDICEKLHTNQQVKTIPDIKRWSHHETCYKPNDIT
ncbi:glycoprotein 3-alpha-L-fucosyltransferase A [Aplysia californica]|uniref:Fucosyltransferase n=1 Tax=Aplysia californica TaxID=6500 RepID=A0ABM0JQS0_APLCA|nr:glycoprotein 3-alpha-L-fucosyltransferase A [Aplysia californica]XP_035825900.1 glycoprotein 3-alpha-L-fucosyltransferase A [Aplysia californica]